MGARKRKGCRNNIFVINGIIHDVMSSIKKEPIQLQIYDYKQMFDAMNLKEAIADIFDAGVVDDQLSLLYQANHDVRMAVNTNSGLSERQNIQDVVLQGDTWGSMLASVQVDSIAKVVEEADYGIRYKDILPVSMLGLVDDVIGITTANHKAVQLNTVMKVKTAEKRLQFGAAKCKTMVVSKQEHAHTEIFANKLTVDKWEVKHVHNTLTGEDMLVESYVGQENMENTNSHKYLGFTLSNKGDNSVNINAMKTKSIWLIRKLFIKLDGLNLQKYYFECAMIFLNVILRSSILYACETYYNLTETQIRQLERIEEGFIRKLLKTSTGCPIVQLYLETGHIPARFAIKKARLQFLKSILEESQESLIYKFLELQFQNPTKGDWVSSCKQDLKDLEIDSTIEELKKMSKYQFSKIVKKSIQKKALEYLLRKQRNKGSEIQYKNLQMAEYLLPNDKIQNINEQRNIFAIRNRMVELPVNFPHSQTIETCSCGNIETMEHIYSCDKWNKNNREKISYEIIYSNDISKQLEISKIFFNNLEHRNNEIRKTKSETHEIQLCDPPSSAKSMAMDCK